MSNRRYYHINLLVSFSIENAVKYRSRSEIVAQMLASAREIEGVTKTRIMFVAYLSYAQLQEYLKLLLENGLLERTPDNKYRTTDKGIKMLDAYQKVNELAHLEND
jgi:predicted transcriptional regulator